MDCNCQGRGRKRQQGDSVGGLESFAHAFRKLSGIGRVWIGVLHSVLAQPPKLQLDLNAGEALLSILNKHHLLNHC